MKKIYSLLFALIAMNLVTIRTHAQSTTGKVYVGYAQYSDQIWEYDGISLDHNAKVGCAILLTHDQLAPYIGGTITGMRVGWDTSTQTGTYEGFVRRTFNGENLTTGKATVRYSYSATDPGWNNMTLTKYEIPEDVDQLVVGFTTTLKKDVCAIPTLYPHGVANSCYLWVDGDFDADGNPRWVDAKETGILPILLVIQDTKGEFNYLPTIVSVIDDGVVESGKASTTLMRVKNNGSQAIKSLEFTSRLGDQTYAQKVTLSQNIAVGATSKPFMAPLFCFETGDVELSITKVNDKALDNPPSCIVNLIGIPSDVSKNYTRRPLVEYFESENNYRSPRYFDEIVEPQLADKLTKLTFVCQHMDDQFMTGDDDATTLALQLCSNDSSQVSIPAMVIDRSMSTDNISYQQNYSKNPMFGVLYEPYSSQAFTAAMKHPTFVAVNVAGNLGDDHETLDVYVDGEMAMGVLPEGEKARLTVYLMEHFVMSDSQLFWSDKEQEEHKGEYVHHNVIREVLSATDGDDLTGGGTFEAKYSTMIDPTWNSDNLYLVAIVHRNNKLGGNHMHVFNSAQGLIDLTNGIGAVSAHANTSSANGFGQGVYDLSGRRMNMVPAQRGIYIVNGQKVAIK